MTETEPLKITEAEFVNVITDDEEIRRKSESLFKDCPSYFFIGIRGVNDDGSLDVVIQATGWNEESGVPGVTSDHLQAILEGFVEAA